LGRRKVRETDMPSFRWAAISSAIARSLLGLGLTSGL